VTVRRALRDGGERLTGVPTPARASHIQLGLRENLGQFSLLVVVSAFVGAMVGLERSILPAIAEQEFQLAARTSALSFIAVFGLTKAATNYVTGRSADRVGRRALLIGGWVLAFPVPLLLMWAPNWSWVLAANALLGVSQGLTWSTTVIMKVDLVGPARRGLAMGLNEFAGYVAMAMTALATAWIAGTYGLRPAPFYLGIAIAVVGLLLSLLARDTTGHARVESTNAGRPAQPISALAIFQRTTFRDRNLSSVTQVGFVNNLNDGMAWGLFPLVFASRGMTLAQVGVLAAIYPGVWSLLQLATGALSDRIGRKWLISSGMWVQAAGILAVAAADTFTGFAAGSGLLGAGTAMVYPTLLAAIGDHAHPSWRASAIGIYRLWRDAGYVAGALLAGLVTDLAGFDGAMSLIGALTAASGLAAAARMDERRHASGDGFVARFL
jgi:MFS family permease